MRDRIRYLIAVAVLLVLSCLSTPAWAQPVATDQWMRQLAIEANGGPSALDQTLAQFIFPGSHVSGSFGIQDFDLSDPFNAPPLACDACISPTDLEILSTPGLDVLIGYLVAPLAKTQKRNIYEQLQDGARAFDLRFFRATASDVARSPELVAGQFYIHHTFAGASSTAVFNDIATFLNTTGHQQEIILLNFSEMYEGSGEMDTAALQTIFNQLLTTVGTARFAPKSLGDGATLAQLAAQGTQVVVSYDGGTPVTNPAIGNLVWPPIATRYFGSPDVNQGGNGAYPKADTWNTEERLLTWTRQLAVWRPNANARYQMYLNMGPDGGADFPDMTTRSLVCNTLEVVNDIQSIVDPIQLIADVLAIKPPPTGSDPTEWTQLKDLLVGFVRDAVTGAATAAAIEEGLDLAGVCPAVNNDWDRFRSLEEVANFTNPKVLPALVGLRRNYVNIVLADYYTTAFTAEAKRLNQGAARLTVTIRNVAELECHDCFPPTGPTAPDYFPEIVFRPNGNVAPVSWGDWPYYPNEHDTIDPGHYSQFGGPWLERSGRNINPNWRAMRSVAFTTPFVDVHLRIWDQDDNLCPDPFWCGADNASKVNGSSTVVGFRQPVWQSGTPLVGNFTAWSAGATGTWVFDSSRVTYNVDVCQWSLIPGQSATSPLCGSAGFIGNTAPDAAISSFNIPSTIPEGSRIEVLGQGIEPDPTINADGDPIGQLASWEWDCAYTGIPDEFELNRGCTNPETYFAPDGGEVVDPSPRGLRFYVTDGPANRVLAFRVTDVGGLTSPIATWPYTVTNDKPAILFPQYTIVQDGNAQRIISAATFTDRGVEDGPFTCEWWDGPVGSGTLLPGTVVVENQGIAYGLDIFGNDITVSQHRCTGTIDVPYGYHVIYFRVLDKDGDPSLPLLGYARDLTLVSNITMAAGLGSPALSNVNSPVTPKYTVAWTGAIEDGYVAAQSGVPGELEWSHMFATITGPGKLTFWWKISGDQYDELEFVVDPGTPESASRGRNIFINTVGWKQETVDILAGAHTLYWNFKNGYLGATNLGRGWVRDVVFTPVVITVSAPLVPGAWSEPYPSTTFAQSGGTNPATWVVATGVLPNGLTLSPAGLLSGTPTQAGEFPVTITATDSFGFFGSGSFTLRISPPMIAPSATVFPEGTAGTAYLDTTITLSSGSAPATFAVTSGALPPGLTLSGAGTLSGIPTWAGTFAFTVTATDANGFTGTRAYTVTVAPGPSAVVTTLANSGAGSLRDVLAAASSGTVITFDPILSGQTIALTSQLFPAKNFAIDASALPGGITISGQDLQRVFVVGSSRHAVLKGVTLTRGFAQSSSASGGCITSSGTLWLIDSTVTGCVAPPGTGTGGGISSTGVLLLTNTTVSGNTAGGTGGGIHSTGSLARAMLIHSTVSGNSAANGGGIHVSAGGALSLENNIVAGNTSGGTGADIGVDVSGSIPTVTTRGVNLIGNNSTVATVFPTGPLAGTLAAPLDPKLAPLGNYGGPTATMAPRTGSPAFNAAVLTVNSPAFDQRRVARPGGVLNDLGAVEGPGAITLSATVFPDGTTGTVYPGTTITLSSGSAPATFVRTAGTLPPGLTLSSAGTVSGTPTWAGTFTFTVRATDVDGFTGTRAYTATVIFGLSAAVTAATDDGVAGSLRAVLTAASSGTVITFDPSLAGHTIALTGGHLPVDKNFVIDASALPGGLTISGEDVQRVFFVSSSRYLALKGLTITRGKTTGSGGCVLSLGGTLSLNDSTVSGCVSVGAGGGIYSSGGALSLTNTTVSGNTTDGNGGGIYRPGSLAPATLVHSTVSGNSGANGGGLYVAAGGVWSIENSIVAGNTTGGTGADINQVVSGLSPTLTASGANLIGDNSTVETVFPAGPLAGTLAAPLDPMLAPLGHYGGPTRTMALLAGSPAVNAALLTVDSPAFDQRGVARPGGVLNDIGAVEGTTVPLVTGLTQNGDFSNGAVGWATYGAPNSSYMESTIVGGVYQWRRAPQTPGQPVSQATIYQPTRVALEAGVPVSATFDIGNTSSARKYMKVLLVGDANFTDLAACAFWLPPNAPLSTFAIRSHTTKAWSNATLYFYASSPNTDGGYYQLDDVSMQYGGDQAADRTECVDPNVPAAPGGPAGPNLLTNGDFSTGVLTPWGTVGTLTTQTTSNVLEFYRGAVFPPPVIAQTTGQAMTANQLVTTTFSLGNSSPVRKRVLILLNDSDFSDLTACTFWIEPGTALSSYQMTGWASKAWGNAMISIYPSTQYDSATPGNNPWIRIDNITMARTPGTATTGTTCLEPAALPLPAVPQMTETTAPAAPSLAGFASPAAARFGAQPVAGSGSDSTGAGSEPADAAANVDVWVGDGFTRLGGATGPGGWPVWVVDAADLGPATLQLAAPLDLTGTARAVLQVASSRTLSAGIAEVQVSVNGGGWASVAAVPRSDGWEQVTIDLSEAAGGLVDVRFVVDGRTPAEAGGWWLSGLEVLTEP